MSKLGAAILMKIDPLFKKPVHPFNLRNDEQMTYADWQFAKAEDTVRLYQPEYSADDLFRDKRVLDLGCGEGGKTCYYASLGAKEVVGVEIVAHYEAAANAFAAKKGLADRFRFISGDATALDFPDESFDTVTMNDFFEHVPGPEAAVKEALRLLKPGGRIFLNFPPYYHPYGAHLSDAIGMPWVHMFFSDDSLIRVYKKKVAELPDGQERIDFRFSTDAQGREYISYINKMTIKRYERIMGSMGIEPEFCRKTPLRGCFRPLYKLPLLREPLTKMVTCVIRKK